MQKHFFWPQVLVFGTLELGKHYGNGISCQLVEASLLCVHGASEMEVLEGNLAQFSAEQNPGENAALKQRADLINEGDEVRFILDITQMFTSVSFTTKPSGNTLQD